MGRSHGQRIARIRATQSAGRGGIHHISAADYARQRHAAREALGHRHQIGHDVVVMHREQLARARKARLHFIGDQQNAVLVAQLAQRAHELGGRRIEAAFALHRLEDDRRDALWIDVGLEQMLDRLQRVGCRHAVQRIRERRVENVGRERTEVQLVRRDLARQRHAHHRAAMKGARERDHARTARRRARDLDRIFDGLGARREESRLLRIVARRALVDLLGQLDIRRIRHDLIRRVRELVQLRTHGLDDLRMAMARVAHGNTRREVDHAAALDVPQLRVLRARGVEIAHHAHAARRGGVLAALQFGILHGDLLVGFVRALAFIAAHAATILIFGSRFQSHFNKKPGANSCARASCPTGWPSVWIAATASPCIGSCIGCCNRQSSRANCRRAARCRRRGCLRTSWASRATRSRRSTSSWRSKATCRRRRGAARSSPIRRRMKSSDHPMRRPRRCTRAHWRSCSRRCRLPGPKRCCPPSPLRGRYRSAARG